MRKEDKKAYEALLDAQIRERIMEMESQEYKFPNRFNRRDYILWAATAAVCLLLLLAGAGL